MKKKYIVRLTDDERKQLEEIVKKGKSSAYKITHANILLTIDANGPGWSDEKTAEAFRCHRNTVCNIRQRLVEKGMEMALERKQLETPSRKRILDGEGEARLIAIGCSKPPEGRAKWTVKMLSDELVALEIVDNISAPTVWRALKKTNFSYSLAKVLGNTT